MDEVGTRQRTPPRSPCTVLDVIADGPLVSEAAHQAVRATDEALGVPLKDVLLGVVGGRRLGQQLWIRVPLQRGDHGQSATTHHVLWHQAVPIGTRRPALDTVVLRQC